MLNQGDRYQSHFLRYFVIFHQTPVHGTRNIIIYIYVKIKLFLRYN